MKGSGSCAGDSGDPYGTAWSGHSLPRRVPEEMRILGEGAAPLPVLTAATGLILASLPPPSSAGET